MEEAKEIWGAIEEQQPAWDLNATWMSFQAWASHFGDREAPALKIMANGRLAGLFPCHTTRRSGVGVSFRVLGSLGNQHWGTGYPIIGSQPDAAIRALIFGLAARRDWDILEIGPMISACPLVRDLEANGKQANLAPMICHREDDWRVRVSGSWDEYYRQLPSKLRRDLARGERRLAALGQVTFEVCTGGPELPELFGEFCRLEASGWKGRGATAIQCDPVVMKFHEDLIRSAASCGQLSLCFLRLNGRAVACMEHIIHNGVDYSIKIGRDEALDDCGVGSVAYKRRLEHLFRTGDAHTLDFMIGGGTHGAYKARWATEKREYVTLRFFNPKTARGVLARTWFAMQSRLADRNIGNALGGGWFPRLIGDRCD